MRGCGKSNENDEKDSGQAGGGRSERTGLVQLSSGLVSYLPVGLPRTLHGFAGMEDRQVEDSQTEDSQAMGPVFALLLLAGLTTGQSSQPEVQPESQPEAAQADEIMARVAANQERSEAARQQYVYKQHIHIATHKPKQRMMREENADYEVAPLEDGIEKHLKSLTGRYWEKDQYVEIKGEDAPKPNKTDPDLVHNLRGFEPMPTSISTDADLIHYLRNSLLDDKSRDGLGRALFPLTFEQQRRYNFKLLGQETESGRNVYRIAFTPKDEQDESAWTGEAYIDAAEFQPVRIFTKISHRPPFLVRTMWFDLPGLGFNLAYQRQEDGVWFPWIFGTEFRMRTGAVLFFTRDVTISVENSGFEHKKVESK